MLLLLIISILLQSVAFAEDYIVQVDDFYTFTNNTSKELIVTTTVYLPYYEDLKYSDHQTVKATPDYQNAISYDVFGNGSVALKNYAIGPQASKSMTFSNVYTISQGKYDLPTETVLPESYDDTLAPFLGNSPFIDLASESLITRQAQLMNEMPAGRRNKSYYVAETIYDYVTQNMCYPLEAVRGDATFAEDNHVGVCEQYSYLMVGLLRLSNIPARTVSGYRFKEAELQDSVEINFGQNDQNYAHMWVEGYFEGIGWVPFDPTRSLNTTKFIDVTINGQVTPTEVYEPLNFQDKQGFANLNDYYLATHVSFDSINMDFSFQYQIAQGEEALSGDIWKTKRSSIFSFTKAEDVTQSSYSFASGRETIVNAYESVIAKEPVVYSDVIGIDWLENDVRVMMKYGNLGAFSESNLMPYVSISREEFAKLLVDSLRIPVNETYVGFDDVVTSKFEDEIQTLHYLQIVNGYDIDGDGVGDVYRGDQSLKRSEVASILNELLNSQIPDTSTDVIFTDMDGHWSRDTVDRVKNFGIVNGYPDETFRPEEEITRGQAIVMINRYLKLYNEIRYLLK